MAKKTKRGTTGEIKIAVNDRRLRLQIPAKYFSPPKQKFLTLGLEDTPANRLKAGAIILNLKEDILNNCLDESLDKYRAAIGLKTLQPSTMQEIWHEYLSYKQKSTKITNYNYLRNNLGRYIDRCPIQSISEAIKVREWLLNETTTFMSKRILLNLNAATKWAIKNKKIELKESPFEGMAAELPKHNWQTSPAPNAFSEQEAIEVLLEFKHNENEHYQHYYHLVKFLLLTGCRPSEAHGLRVEDINLKKRIINFRGSIVRVAGKIERLEGSKNNKSRQFPINDELLELVSERIGLRKNPEELLFLSFTGKTIDHSYFCKAIWNPVVSAVLERDSTPYSCRDTFITLQLLEGIAPATVCAWCDTSIGVIQTRYLDPLLSRSISPVPITAKIQ